MFRGLPSLRLVFCSWRNNQHDTGRVPHNSPSISESSCHGRWLHHVSSSWPVVASRFHSVRCEQDESEGAEAQHTAKRYRKRVSGTSRVRARQRHNTDWCDVRRLKIVRVHCGAPHEIRVLLRATFSFPYAASSFLTLGASGLFGPVNPVQANIIATLLATS